MELYTYARLTDGQLEQVRSFEAQVGKKLLVLKKTEMQAAELSKRDVEALQALEAELGLVAVVVK